LCQEERSIVFVSIPDADLDKSAVGCRDPAENLLKHAIFGILRTNLEPVAQQPFGVGIAGMLAQFEVQRFYAGDGL
jgi:hypothetical protein